MLLDKRSTFARELSIPAAGTAKFGEAIPLSVRANQGEGYPLYLVVSVPVAGVGGTSFALELVTDDNEALTSPTVLAALGTWPLASLTLGAQLFAGPIPQAFYETFVGLRQTTVGVFSAGKINAFLITDPPSWRAYANGMV
jgi:hypothetical protein